MAEETLNANAEQTAEQTDEKVIQKRSELIKEQIALEKQYNEESQKIVEETYFITVGSKNAFDKIYKYIETSVEWDYTTATGVALLFTNLKQQKPFTREKDWDGKIELKTSSCLSLWKMFMSMKGRGFYEARNFLDSLMLVGPELSKTVGEIQDKQLVVRHFHDRINVIDNLLDAGEYENDITDEEAKALYGEKEESLVKREEKLEDEVLPEA